MFYCRQKNDIKKEVYYAEWANECVSLMSQFGFDHIFRNMKIGERRRYFAHVELFCYRDYFGEYDNNMHIFKMKRVK